MRVAKIIFKWIPAIAFVFAGFNHFINSEFYLKIMPPVLPAPLFLVYLSGVFEIILGALLLISRFTRVAAWSLIALLIAVFPANIYMATNAERFQEFSPFALWLRLPLQFVIIFWVYLFTKTENANVESKD